MQSSKLAAEGGLGGFQSQGVARRWLRASERVCARQHLAAAAAALLSQVAFSGEMGETWRNMDLKWSSGGLWRASKAFSDWFCLRQSFGLPFGLLPFDSEVSEMSNLASEDRSRQPTASFGTL